MVALVVPSSVPPFHHRWRYYPSVGDFATAGVYDRTAIFCCCGGDGTRESSCAGGDAVMYRAGGGTPKRWLFCPAGDRA